MGSANIRNVLYLCKSMNIILDQLVKNILEMRTTFFYEKDLKVFEFNLMEFIYRRQPYLCSSTVLPKVPLWCNADSFLYEDGLFEQDAVE